MTTTRTLDAAERKQHLDFINDPDKWPHWPLLPMKNFINGFSHPHSHGIIVDVGGFDVSKVEPKVYIANLMFFRGEDMDKYEKDEYQSFDELIDAGWIVD